MYLSDLYLYKESGTDYPEQNSKVSKVKKNVMIPLILAHYWKVLILTRLKKAKDGMKGAASHIGSRRSIRRKAFLETISNVENTVYLYVVKFQNDNLTCFAR